MNELVTIIPLLKNPNAKNHTFRLSFRSLQKFINLTWQIPAYKNHESKKNMPLYIQELSDLNPDSRFPKNLFPGSNPFFRHVRFLQYFLALQNEQTVGRIAVYIDTTYHEPDTKGEIGWIGLFECIESKEVAHKLIQTAINLLKCQGVEKIIGPARFNANGEVGVTIDGFHHHPMFMEPYHPPYYQEYFEAIGKKENDWYAFHIEHKEVESYANRANSIRRNGLTLEEKMKENGIIIRSVKLKKLVSESEKIKFIYNTAWDTKEHPQFEKMTDAEFKSLVSALVLLAVESLILIVEDRTKKDNPVVGMSVLLPDINEAIEIYDAKHPGFRPGIGCYPILRSLKRDLGIVRLVKKMIRNQSFHGARVVILGTIIKKTGLDALLYLKCYENAKRYGIQFGSGSQIADTNLEMVNPLQRMGHISLTWRIYKFE